MKRKPKAVVVPFGYWGYPEDLMDKLQKESAEAIKAQGVDVTTISRVDVWKDAKATAAELRKLECDFIVVLVMTWLEAPNLVETLQEQFNKPLLLWSHTMFPSDDGKEMHNLGAIAGVGVIRETFEELGLQFKFVWGMPDSKKVQDKIKLYSSVLATADRLKHSKIGMLGYGSMGMYTAYFDHLSLKQNIGPEIEQIDQYVLIKKLEEMEDAKVKGDVETAKKDWEVSEAVNDKDLCTTFKMHKVLKDMAKEFDWSALTVKCQYELSKYYKNVPCVPLSMLGDEMPCSCEADVPLITTQLIMYYLSRGKTVTYCDIHDITETSLICAACGYAPFGMGKGCPKVDKTETLYEGVANCTVYREGEVTAARLAYTKDRTYKMHIIGGQAHDAKPFREVGCLTYPSMEIELDGDTDTFGNQMMSQHYAIMYGNYRRELSEFCSLLGIQAVYC
ncbi:MAG: hypothetical protein KAH23_10085 [Kiritimatiellae bacterium]|nr:hypothetical protein [Kiritimatiellia bacterium]